MRVLWVLWVLCVTLLTVPLLLLYILCYEKNKSKKKINKNKQSNPNKSNVVKEKRKQVNTKIMAQQVADILGCDLAMAEGLFEAAGGSVELAIELGFSSGNDRDDNGGGGSGFSDNALGTGGFQVPYSHYQAIWPENAPLSEAWQSQRLDAFQETNNNESADTAVIMDTIVQDQNGPCGVLAVVQAELWLLQDVAANKSEEDRLTMAVSNILERVVRMTMKSSHISSSSSSSSTDTAAAKVTLADGSKLDLMDAAKQIRTASGLVEAVASTAGIGTTVTRMTPLVEGPHWLCSSDLLMLLLRGYIGNEGSFAAYNAITKEKSNFYDSNNGGGGEKIGLLSMMELDDKIPVADDLKFDKQVWILHTGDHFVTMRRAADQSNTMEIYDGLKPNGPVTKYFTIQGDTALASKAPEKHVEGFVKKRTGQPDDLVQARKTDSSNYKDWTFEVVPAVDDPDVQGPLDTDPNEPVYNFQELPLPTHNWRCASCYSNRFKTMNFGTNPAGAEVCEVCHLPARQSMWSLWLSFEDLSPKMQKRARQMYAPKLELILSTLYPRADIAETSK